MHDETRHNAASRTTGESGDANIDKHGLTDRHAKSGTPRDVFRRSKSDAKFWFRRLFKAKSERGTESPYWSVKIQFRGRRTTFSLNTSNKDAAARRALALYDEIVTRNIDAVIADRRGGGNDRDSIVTITIGQWVEAAKSVFAGSPETFGGYVRSLRQIASEIVGMDKDPKRFEPVQSGEFRRKIDAMPLSILTPDAIQRWRIAYVAKNGTDPARARAARISCNSTIRQAKSLFGKKIVKFSGVEKLPDPLPFADVEFYPRESMRYHSKIDPVALMRVALTELAETDPSAFLALLLALGAGLRRGEIDRLLWRQIDCTTGIIHVHVTEAGGLKSADSTGAVHVDGTLATILQGYRARATGEFVIEAEQLSSSPTVAPWSRKYRCEAAFARLIQWLRDHGVEGQKPLHVLRKEAGSIVATQHGIYAASKFLRHADIQVTTMHYADHKERVAIDMSALMPPNMVDPPRQKRG